jgi:hypothetical protein
LSVRPIISFIKNGGGEKLQSIGCNFPAQANKVPPDVLFPAELFNLFDLQRNERAECLLPLVSQNLKPGVLQLDVVAVDFAETPAAGRSYIA